jgi:hypothetical protein
VGDVRPPVRILAAELSPSISFCLTGGIGFSSFVINIIMATAGVGKTWKFGQVRFTSLVCKVVRGITHDLCSHPFC